MSTTHAAPAQPIRLYRHPLSGHAHRVELFCRIEALPGFVKLQGRDGSAAR